jgi:hypothetical protein
LPLQQEIDNQFITIIQIAKMIKQFLKQPHLLFENQWKLIIPVSLLITFFLLIFQPFGLSAHQGKTKIYITCGYGCVTFIMLVINFLIIPFLFKNWFNTKSWTVAKQIIWHNWTIFTVGIANYLYSSVMFSIWNLHRFFIFQYYTLVVGLIPITIFTIVRQNLLLARYLKSAKELNIKLEHKSESLENEPIISLTSETGKDKLKIGLSKILYIESTGNYIRVFYIRENKLSSMLLRNTLKCIEAQVHEVTSLIKCHRAFLVNINTIKRVKGNSQGLKLVLKNTETEIPVSRNFSKNLKDLINQNNVAPS